MTDATDATNGPGLTGTPKNTDAVPAGTPDAGENVCRRCNGSGEVDGKDCPECGGTGTILTPVGGAG